jgi:hypothetical protein
MNTNMNKPAKKTSIITVSIAFPADSVRRLDAYRGTQQFSPSRSKVCQTVIEAFLQEQLAKMPWLDDAQKEQVQPTIPAASEFANLPSRTAVKNLPVPAKELPAPAKEETVRAKKSKAA